jgi:hypothetical protein
LAETLVGVEAFEELSGKAEALAGVLVVVAWATKCGSPLLFSPRSA